MKGLLGAPMNKRHPFKWLIYNGERIPIDRDIVPLIAGIWKLGIKTTSCCQAHCSLVCNHKRNSRYEIIPTKHCHDNVWIAFETVKDMERLFDVVAQYDDSDGSMYDLMSCDNSMSYRKKQPKDCWAFDFYMRNDGVKGHWGRPIINGKRSSQQLWIDDGCEENGFVVQPQLTFPRKHLSYVEERIKLALENG